MTISGITPNTAASAKSGSTKPGELGRDDFLNLLVTQLQYQDPLNPMDSTDFTAQLAQFSSLEQLSNMNTKMDELTRVQGAFANAQAVGYIGRDVLATGNQVALREGQTSALAVELASPAANVYFSIYDGNGAFVDTFEAGAMGAGRQVVAWDGIDPNGNALPAGVYRFEVNAVGSEGSPLPAQPLSSGRVEGVTFRDGSAYLMMERREIRLEDVIEVIQASAI
jgi:flagellar basal-body rod modification protein FlgD